jgi:hypothetical protein
MFRAPALIVVLILLLAGGLPAEMLCGAWCGEGRLAAMCHDVTPVASACLKATHGCAAPGVVAALPQQSGGRAAHGGPCDVPPSVFELPQTGEHHRLRLEVPLVPFARQLLSRNLRI